MPTMIRPATAADYEIIAALSNRAYSDAAGQPLSAITADDLRDEDHDRPPHITFGRWVAEHDGAVVGVCMHDQAAHRYDPRRFWADVFVDPAHQRQGIGGALYALLEAELHRHNAALARTALREDLTHSLSFLEQRGWEVAMRTWESFLDLAALDLVPFGDVLAPLAARGILIQPRTALMADPDHERKIYELTWEICQDMPEIDPATKEPFEVYLSKRLNDPHVPPELYFIATQGAEYVGFSNFRVYDDDPTLIKIGATGVARAARRQGIAHALKIHGLRAVKERSYRTVRTTNELNNRGILQINDRLGFVRRPAWLDLTKTFE